MSAPSSIFAAARYILEASDLEAKVSLSLEAAEAWRQGQLTTEPSIDAMPARPGRPAKPELIDPREMPKRSSGGVAGRVAMLHAVAHIELNAIDLAWDMVGRFGNCFDNQEFIDDWVRIGAEEASHFSMIRERLQQLNADYGDLPAHDGLWEAAESTADDVAARLAIVPLVLEARGLDVSPQMAARFRKFGDEESARRLDVIYTEEVGHVAAGMRWFKEICAKRGQESVSTYHALVAARFRGGLKPPFNEVARAQAGLLPAFYQGL